jgi:hypothetical protein
LAALLDSDEIRRDSPWGRKWQKIDHLPPGRHDFSNRTSPRGLDPWPTHHYGGTRRLCRD